MTLYHAEYSYTSNIQEDRFNLVKLAGANYLYVSHIGVDEIQVACR